jgi:hypothetical protein
MIYIFVGRRRDLAQAFGRSGLQVASSSAFLSGSDFFVFVMNSN